MLHLSADATYQKVPIGRQFAQNDGWPIFDLSISLRYRSQNYLSFVHDLNSGLGVLIRSEEYSGSFGP